MEPSPNSHNGILMETVARRRSILGRNMDHCNICERRCRLAAGQPGACGLYESRDGTIVERYPDQFLVVCPISIETMPMLHFQPGSKFLQITTTGCNFHCPGCISAVLVNEMSPDSPALQHLTAEQVVERAIDADCAGIVFLMNDPLAAFPRFLRIAERARHNGLKVGCSSNTYFTPESLSQLMPFLDFINIGMKGFSDTAYQACGVPSIRPVLRNLEALYRAGVHIEISCILTRHNAAELFDLARHMGRLSRCMPLQVMRFLPFENAAIDLEPSIREAEDFCLTARQFLDYVYLFNTPGSDALHTRCPLCGHVVLYREFYGPMGAKLRSPMGSLPADNSCPACPHYLSIIGPPAASVYQEGDFEGGYPLTRAMEIVEAMFIAMGVTRRDGVVAAWEEMLRDGGLRRLHQSIQHPRTYIAALRDFGRTAGVAERAEALAIYLEKQLARVADTLSAAYHRPRVYYAMGKPRFYINGGRMENQLVELAGGISLNKTLPAGGRPGRNLPVAQLNALDPDIIFISAFLSNRVDDFIAECLALGITVKAVRNRKVFVHPAPGWDFGSPRWVLGLLHMAKVFHPERCRYNVTEEAQIFYRGFYGIDFDPQRVNRSFAKPSDAWQWPPDAIDGPESRSRVAEILSDRPLEKRCGSALEYPMPSATGTCCAGDHWVGHADSLPPLNKRRWSA